MMYSHVVRTLLVAAALTQANAVHPHDEHDKEECACAQAEADHPFTIDCDNAAAIRAATTTLETTCAEATSEYEWGGAFATPANAYKWVSQATLDPETNVVKYADAEMRMVVFAAEADHHKHHLLDLVEQANSLMAGSCPVVSTGGTIPAPTAAGACYTLTFPTTNPATTDFHATVNTAGVANVAFFTAHMPTEFERDTHYFVSTDLATDVEPEAQTDALEYNCKFHKDASQVKVCAQAFLVIQAHHDYCPHDTLTRWEEELFHEWEGKCYGCNIVRKYDASLKKCPVIDCTDATVATLGYNYLAEKCTAADTSYPFEWAGIFDTPDSSYTWVSQAETNATVASGKKYADDYMILAAFTMTSNRKSALFGLKDRADTLMSSGPCPEVTASCFPGNFPCPGSPAITPTADGVCITIKFPNSSLILKDFHLTVNTPAGIAYMALFTAHLPTEFERDEHYLTSADGTRDIWPVHTLGEGEGHDHGRRLAAVGPNDRRSQRRLANAGSCCNDAMQQGAWTQVVSYHDLCDHDQVPEFIEVGFHDYEKSCEDHFCNLVEAGVDQTVCASPPPPASTCAADLAQCEVDASLNAAQVLQGLKDQTIKLVFV